MSGVSAMASQLLATPVKTDIKEVFICIDDAQERLIAEAWLSEKKPGSKLLTTLNLQRLGPNLVLIPLIRGDDRSPSSVKKRDDHGRSYIEHRTPHDQLANGKRMIDEVRMCKPVKVADYWRGDQDDYGALSGELNRSPFHQAMAQSCSPIKAEVHVGTPDVMHLVFV